MRPDRLTSPLEDIHEMSNRSDEFSLLALTIPVLGILLSELALFFDYISYALWGHFLTLLICVFAPLVITTDVRLLQAFALVPLFRLVNLGMPVFTELTLYWLLLVYAPLLPAIYVIVTNDEKLTLRSDPRAAAIFFPPSIALAVVLAELEYRILSPEALIPEWAIGQLLLLMVVMVGFVALVEELLFRGVVQHALEMRFGQWPGILIASVIFGLMHSTYGSGWGVLFATGVGVLFGVIYDWTESIEVVIIIHGLLNVFLFGIIPIQALFR